MDAASKEQTITGLIEARQAVLEAAAELRPEARSQIFLGTWSAKELVAHLIGWDYTNRAAAEEIMASQLPSFYDHHTRDWAKYNEHLIAEHGRDDWDELLAAARHSHQELIAFLQALPADEFERDRGIRAGRWKVTIGRLLRVEASDEVKHSEQVRAFARSAAGKPNQDPIIY